MNDIQIFPAVLTGLLTAIAILWLGFYLGIRFQKSKDKEGKDQKSSIPIVATRTLEELKQELDEDEYYAHYQGWLTLKELTILRKSGYKLISGPAFNPEIEPDQEYWFEII